MGLGLVFKGLVYRTRKKDRNWTEQDRLGPDRRLQHQETGNGYRYPSQTPVD